MCSSDLIVEKKQSTIQVVNGTDIDPLETQDWLESLSAVISKDGNQRAHFLIKELINKAYREGANIPYTQNTPYINTIPPEAEVKSSGDQNIERRIRSLIRWNAAAMVVRANKKHPELGGHIGTFASAATLYDVGMNHFWRAKNNKFGGDLIYFQGHSAPGMYARAFLEGRLNEKQLDSFRQEVKPGGLSSYPHPWLMPKFWQFPTVSMGLGPMLAIYQARYMKYLINRGLIKDEGRKVWAFLGDGEMDEPESMGAIGLAARENLDNLIFVFTSENGPWLEMGEEGGTAGILRGGKGSTWEGGIRVPTVIWGPGYIKPGVVDDIGTSMDLFTTFSYLADVEVPNDRIIDGNNLSNVFKSLSKSPTESFFYYWGSELMAVRYKSHKLHLSRRIRDGNC